MTGFLPLNRPAGQRLLRGLAAAGEVVALAACGSQSSGSLGPGEPGTAAAQSAGPDGTTLEIGGSVDVIDASIPAPPPGSDTAQVEMTLADISTAGPDTLRAASSRTTGPPYPDRILLTGLRRGLRAGQTVTISLEFARAGHATLQVPVIPSAP